MQERKPGAEVQLFIDKKEGHDADRIVNLNHLWKIAINKLESAQSHLTDVQKLHGSLFTKKAFTQGLFALDQLYFPRYNNIKIGLSNESDAQVSTRARLKALMVIIEEKTSVYFCKYINLIVPCNLIGVLGGRVWKNYI